MGIRVNPHKVVRTDSNSEGTFYLADCLEVFRALPAASVDVMVTSPPYNMGIRYNTYQDSLDADDYLRWTSEWIGAARRVLTPDGSLFLNVGTRPSDPWTALDVAQAARPHLKLQNIIHWVKSVAIDQAAAGAGAGLTRDLAVGHYKPINSERYLNDCHEFVFHFTPAGTTRLDRLALGVPYQDPSNSMARRIRGGPLPRQHVVHSVRDDSAARPRPTASGHLPGEAARAVHPPARTLAGTGGDGSLHGTREHGRRLCAARRELRWRGHRPALPGRSGRAHERRDQRPHAARPRACADGESRGGAYGFLGSGAAAGLGDGVGARSTYSLRE
jgi:hypothetical protein